jgi:hypothetical protein
LKSLLGERIHPWLREKAKGKVHIDWANMGIEAASANRTQTASNTIICQRAVFGPGPSHTTIKRCKISILQKRPTPPHASVGGVFRLWLPDFGTPPEPCFAPFFGVFSLYSLFLPDDQVTKSGRHIPLYSNT